MLFCCFGIWLERKGRVSGVRFAHSCIKCQLRRTAKILVRGAERSFDPRALSPKFAQNRGFPLKLPENCMIWKKWGQGAQGPLDPLVLLSWILFPFSTSKCGKNCFLLKKNKATEAGYIGKIHMIIASKAIIPISQNCTNGTLGWNSRISDSILASIIQTM